MKITNTEHRVAIQAAQDIVVALVMHAGNDIVHETKETKKSNKIYVVPNASLMLH